MYFVGIVILAALVLGFLSVSIFFRGKIQIAGWATALGAVIGVFLGLATAGVATSIDDNTTVSKWPVEDVRRNSTSDGVFYSYYNNDILYNFGTDPFEYIRSTDKDYTYRERVCGVTPEHFLPFGDFGQCTDYLYVTESDR